MRGSSAVILIVGMFLAAVVGVTASLGIQSLMSQKKNETEKEDSSKVVAKAVEDKVSALDRSLQTRFEALMTSIEALSSRITETEKKVEKLAKEGGVATAPKVAAREGATQNVPVDEETIEEMIEKAIEKMEEAERKKKEEEAMRRARGLIERGYRLTLARLKERVEKQNWDINKKETVKAILDEQIEKLDELLEEGLGREALLKKARETYLGTKTRLGEVLTEEEINELYRRR